MSLFAKRHYERLALIMQEILSDADRPGYDIAYRHFVESLASGLSRENHAFKTDRFLRACRPGANVKARS